MLTKLWWSNFLRIHHSKKSEYLSMQKCLQPWFYFRRVKDKGDNLSDVSISKDFSSWGTEEVLITRLMIAGSTWNQFFFYNQTTQGVPYVGKVYAEMYHFLNNLMTKKNVGLFCWYILLIFWKKLSN